MKRQNQIPKKNRFSELPLRRISPEGLLCFILVLITHSAGAQQKDWQWIKSGGALIEGTEVERVYDIATDSDRNVYVVSPIGVYDLEVDGHPETFYGDPGSSHGDYVLASFACDGSYRWSKVIGGDGNEQPPFIEVDDNDNLYVTGGFRSCDPHENPNDYPSRIGDDIILDQSQDSCSLLFIAKFDQDGNLLWFERPMDLTSSNIAKDVSSQNLALDSNGNIYWLVYLVSGSYANGAFINTMDGGNWFIFKYGSDGEFVSALYMDIQLSPGVAGLSLKMYRNPYNGHFYFTGNRDTNGFAVIGGETVTGGLYIACFDPQGIFQWMRQSTYVNSVGGSKIYGLEFDAQNNIYLGGCMLGNFDGIEDSFLGYSVDEALFPGYVMKTNPTAQGHIWGSHNISASGSGIGALEFEKNILSFTDIGIGQDFTWGSQVIDINNNESYEVLLAQFNPLNGNCLNLDFIQGDPGYEDYGTALAVDANGDILVGGQFQHLLYDASGNTVENGNTTATDFFIAKYASEACEEMGVEEVLKTSIEIYPNPVSGKLYVSVKGETAYRLYDVLGELVLKGNLTETQNNIGTENLPAGLYVLELEDMQGNVETMKVVVE